MVDQENENVEKRVKSLLVQFQYESAILDKIVHKMKNQHRRAFYFQYLLKVKRDVTLVKSANLEGILNFLFHVIKEKKPDIRAKKRKLNNESRQFHLRLLGGARLLSQMVEPMVKAAIEFSTLLARSFFQSFSLAMLALLARLRILVQQILLDVVLVFNMFSTTQGTQSTILNFGVVEVVREFYPSDNDVIALDCVWETDKFVLLEKTNKNEIENQVHRVGGGLDSPLIPCNIKYQTIETFIGDDDPGYGKKDAGHSLEDPSGSSNQFVKINEEMTVDNDDEKGGERSPKVVINASTSSFPSQNLQSESRSKVAFVSVGRSTLSQMKKSTPPKTASDKEDTIFSLLTAGDIKDGIF